jgi:hypothetical protein
MKMRLTPPVAGRGAWLIAGRSAAAAVLLAVTVSACTGGGSSAPSVLPPSAPTSGPSSSTPTHTATPTDTPTPTHTPTPVPTFPTAAPETGGGGTAGLQDSLLFGTGAAAVLVGFGTLAYRRRLARKLGGNDPASPDPADKESADR